MHTTIQLLNELSKKFDRASDYRLAQLLKTSPSAINNYRKGRTVPSPIFAARIAKLLDMDVAYVYTCTEHERLAHMGVPVKADEESHQEVLGLLTVLERMAWQFSPTKAERAKDRKTARKAGRAAAVVLAFGTAFTGISAPSSTQTSASELPSNHDYVNRRRRRASWRGTLRIPLRRIPRRRHERRHRITALPHGAA